MSEPENCLVVGPSWVGDMVMAQSLFMSLRTQNPQSSIDVLAPAWSVDLLNRMPEVRKAHILNVAHGELGLVKRWRVAQQLKHNQYQRAIVLPRSFKSALVPFWARIPVRTGFRTEMRYGLLNDLRKLDSRLDQTVKRFVALGASQETDPIALACPQPRLQTSDVNVQELLANLKLSTDRPVIGLMPGAEYGPAKQWPVEYFRELAGQLVKRNYAIWIFGSQKEVELGRRIASVSPQSINNLCGRTSLVDAIDLIAQLDVAISNDSGLMHIAAAVDVSLIAVYGSSSPLYTPPLSEKAVIEYLGLECSPCYKRQCPFGHYACLKNLSVNLIMEHIDELVSGD